MNDILSRATDLWRSTQSLLALLGVAGISVTGVVAGAYALFRFLGEKWLTNKFAEQLESFKSEQARELERLRHRINAVFDRTKRLHDREFEKLPEVWVRLVDAKSWSGGYLAAFQQYTDVGRMGERELDEFLGSTSFSESQKTDIKSSPRRQDLYVRLFNLYRHADVMAKLREASISLTKHGIFIVPDLRKDMHKWLDIVHSAVLEHHLNEDPDLRPRLREASNKLKEEGEPLFQKIEDAVVARLWDSTETEV
ncbi:hypothetical protein [Rhizobium sp. S96]|uniref:hypothetical protein n=1 Tax=Rhizobium sp. S96 TaxID=3055140 RepID=UPI0025AA51C9|nr:hypothetical protein [Rhizobium sp. S96]MDM9621114.1 hypothetical protein [Rhizobium sp. S96]